MWAGGDGWATSAIWKGCMVYEARHPFHGSSQHVGLTWADATCSQVHGVHVVTYARKCSSNMSECSLAQLQGAMFSAGQIDHLAHERGLKLAQAPDAIRAQGVHGLPMLVRQTREGSVRVRARSRRRPVRIRRTRLRCALEERRDRCIE